MTEVIRAAAELQGLCEARGWRFCFIGGLALQRWGEPRETVDVDLTLVTGFGGEEHYLQPLLEHFESRRQQLKPLAELKGAPELLLELEKRKSEFER